MYGKLFASLYQGTLRGKSHEILVFTNLIACSDRDGYVDKHWNAIADEVGLTVEQVKKAIINLESPDHESRSLEEEGRRLIPMDSHRAWGWKIVNYPKYRAIRNAEDRREQNRLAQQKHRNKKEIYDEFGIEPFQWTKEQIVSQLTTQGLLGTIEDSVLEDFVDTFDSVGWLDKHSRKITKPVPLLKKWQRWINNHPEKKSLSPEDKMKEWNNL